MVDQADIQSPSKRETRQTLPYLSGDYNFSKVMGFNTFEPKNIVYTCQLIERDSTDLDKILTEINSWLLVPVEAVLQDTATPNYHYIGDCTSVVPASNEDGYCELTITFKVQPFKISNNDVSMLEWDSINFDADYLTQTEFSIKGGGTIILHNEGAEAVEFTCVHNVADLLVEVGNTTYTLSSGTKAGFKLKPGDTKVEIVGFGCDSSVSPLLVIKYNRLEL